MMEKRNLLIAACIGIPYVASLLADCTWLTLVTTLIGFSLFVREIVMQSVLRKGDT